MREFAFVGVGGDARDDNVAALWRGGRFLGGEHLVRGRGRIGVGVRVRARVRVGVRPASG